MSNSSKALTGLLVGVAVGVAVGYFLNSEKKDELVETVKDQAKKLKEKAGKMKERLQHTADPVDEIVNG